MGMDMEYWRRLGYKQRKPFVDEKLCHWDVTLYCGAPLLIFPKHSIYFF